MAGFGSATRTARRLWPVALELYRRWERLPPEQKERYRRLARENAQRSGELARTGAARSRDAATRSARAVSETVKKRRGR
jgi:hypothetical protein